jgi:hypothetical protein
MKSNVTKHWPKLLLTHFVFSMSNIAWAACESEKEAAYKSAGNPRAAQTMKEDFAEWEKRMQTGSTSERKTHIEFTKNQVEGARTFPGQLVYATAVHCVVLAAAGKAN